jgi:hypothetical protein
MSQTEVAVPDALDKILYNDTPNFCLQIFLHLMVGNRTQDLSQYRTCSRDLSPYTRVDTEILTCTLWLTLIFCAQVIDGCSLFSSF